MTQNRTLARRGWWGAIAGGLLGLIDTATLLYLGVTFEMAGRSMAWGVALFFGSSFALLGYLAVDLWNRRRRERDDAERFAALQARLAQSEKLASLGQLAAAIAHEVRNPLGVVRSAAQGLAETLPATDAASQRSCSFIIDEVDRLATVVNALLAFARPLQPTRRAVAVGDLVDRALQVAGQGLAAKGVRVHRPDLATLPTLDADADLACQAIVGLLTNAGEALSSGGEVTVGARADGNTIVVEVADTGPGVPEALRARIFEPFYTTRSGGTGLGLAVVRQIVEAHGGRVDVHDRPGGGAVFALRWPLAAGSLAA